MERHLVGRLLSLLALCTATCSLEHQPSYLLLIPQSVRPGVPVSLSVSILTSSNLQVSALISSGNQTLSSNRTTVTGGSTMLLLLPPIHMDDATYRHPLVLQVHGYDGRTMVFVNRTELHLDPKCFSTFIQTDRDTYQPGQEVKIRVVTLDPHGKPYSGPVDIFVSDPRGTRLRQWLHQEAVLGVVSKHFRLSDHPPLGQWRIDVAAAKDVFSEKSFTVAYHVQPKFEVVIKAPRMVHQQDVLHGSVCAKYTHGKPVQGRMNIIFTYYYHGMEDVLYDYKLIDGEADFLFDVPDYHLMYRRSMHMSDYGSNMEDQLFVSILVNVTEHLTGLTHHSTAKVYITKFRYRLSFDSYSSTLKPSMTFSARLKITEYDGEPLTQEDLRKTVHLSVTQKKSWKWEMRPSAMPHFSTTKRLLSEKNMPDENMPEEMELPISADGEVHLSIPISERTESLTVDAYFGDSYTSLHLYRDYTSPSHSYLSIERHLMPLEVGSAVQLHVHSSFPLMEIHYVVKSRGQLVSAGTTNTAMLILFPEFSWAPHASVIVYCVHPSGEIVSDAAQLHVVQTLRNWVSLSWSQWEVEPGDDVTLKVEVVEPASLVGILVVDKATKWAGSHNDITMDVVMKELGGSSSCGLVGSGDPHSLFQSCDLIALTDAMLPMMEIHKEKPYDEVGEHPYQQKYEPHVEMMAGPETWMWMDVFTNDSLEAEVHVSAPDGVTTWCATAFVMSENLGLGLLPEPVELTVSQSLYASLNLPAHIVRGEELLLEVVLFNYLQVELQVMVVVAQSDSFLFVYPDHHYQVEPLPGPSVRRLLVASQSGATVLVPVRPLLLGLMPVSVKIQSIAGAQRLHRMVLVKAEGLQQSFSSSLLLDVSPPQVLLSSRIFFSFPPNLVEGSKRVLVTATGDLLGPSISGLDSLVQMPFGCGEQNMINFAPNVYVLQYLEASRQQGEQRETVDRATEFMMAGYERQLSYQRADGSFSAFGERDAFGSTWLSAFVLRCFLQARPFMDVDHTVLHNAAYFLSVQQGADGRFEERGRVIHTELLGGLDGPTSLTAYVLAALLQDDGFQSQFSGQVTSALIFLETRLALGVSSNYSLGLLTYALALAGSSSANDALNELIGRAQMDDGVPTWSWWDSDSLSPSWQPRSAELELASYVLLSLQRLGRAADGVQLARWLSRQRNHGGGFGSTQDTVVALQALATFAALTAAHHDVTVKVNSNATNTVATFHIHHGNQMLQQSQQIEAEEPLDLLVTAEGHGLALVQLNVFYNVRSEEQNRGRSHGMRHHEAFHLHVELQDVDLNSAHLVICASLQRGIGLNATGMAVLEAYLPSGFGLAMTPDDLVAFHHHYHQAPLKKVETPPGKVIFYLDSVTLEEVCLEAPLVLEVKVARVQEASVTLYDYYEPRRRAVRTYTSLWRADMSSSSFCGYDDECGDSTYYSAAAPLLVSQLPLKLLLLLHLLLHLHLLSN